jgi:hypothetical protein
MIEQGISHGTAALGLLLLLLGPWQSADAGTSSEFIIISFNCVPYNFITADCLAKAQK